MKLRKKINQEKGLKYKIKVIKRMMIISDIKIKWNKTMRNEIEK